MKLPLLPLLIALVSCFQEVPVAAQDDGGSRAGEVDAFHPDKATEVTPKKGGSFTIHLPGLPKNLNYMIENSSYTRSMLYEMHEYLVLRNWETWEHEAVLAEGWDTEDAVIPKGGRGENNENVIFGRVEDTGDAWLVHPLSEGNPLEEPLSIPKDKVESVERQTVFTFRLRDGVKWHDGKTLDANDVYFSWRCYLNEFVDCDQIRFKYQKLVHAEVLDPLTIRFFYQEQYFDALGAFDSLVILPSHLYNLKDPEHPRHDPNATAEAQGKEINENEHNTAWVGLGPYRLTEWSEQAVQARRFEDYFNPERGGYMDLLVWRHIPNDDAAFQALINGELDFLFRITSDNYFGEATQKPEFLAKAYKGYYYPPALNYTPWNTRKPLFSDPNVRKAMAHAFDFEDYRKTISHGLARLPTGTMFFSGPAYNRDVERFPYDLDKAEEMLAEAGWYDRDGDDVIDKDGIPFEFDFLAINGNKASQLFSQKLQENLGKIGIKINIVQAEWASFLEVLQNREFNAAGLAWSLDVPESDPEQLWHSKWAGERTSNHAGVADEYVDELIEKGQRELDDEKRYEIWRELHRYLYEEVQPYLFRMAPPRKFGMSNKVRGFKIYEIDPCYVLRELYYPAD